jgi:hypothetical protein
MRLRTTGLRRTLLAGCFVSLVVVPLNWVSTLAHSDLNQRILAQIEFTPNVATLQAQGTPYSILSPLVWEAGRTFDCPVGLPERCRPKLSSIVGDDYFGYGGIPGSPDLRLIWVTDEQGTHYFVVGASNGEFASEALRDDFSDFIEQRSEAITARNTADSSGNTTGVVGGLAVGLLALCPETWGLTCLGAAITIAVGGVINIINQSALENAAEESLAAAETNLIGKFGQLRLSPGNPGE